MRYASVCSGIEAPSVAWESLGWEPQWFSEIEPFPCAILNHHYPNVPNLGDMTKIHTNELIRRPIDLLIGGTPCQSFSIAGLRGGLDDDRGNLALTYLRLVDQIRPRWFIWENVPGVLSSNKGRDFGTFLGAVGKLGYGWSYRVLDAQYWGVPQRRRRVFVVGHLGGWRGAASVLFESTGLSRNPAPSKEKRKAVASPVSGSTSAGFSDRGGGLDNLVAGTLGANYGSKWGSNQDINEGMSLYPLVAFGGNNTSGPIDLATAVNASPSRRYDFESETFIAFGTTQVTSKQNGSNPQPGNLCHPLTARGHPPALAYNIMPQNSGKDYKAKETGVCQNLTTSGNHSGNQGGTYIAEKVVRRLSVLECERLQGFPDGYTNIPYGRPKFEDQICPDGHRYRSLGNSMATPVIKWLGERIMMTS